MISNKDIEHIRGVLKLNYAWGGGGRGTQFLPILARGSFPDFANENQKTSTALSNVFRSVPYVKLEILTFIFKFVSQFR